MSFFFGWFKALSFTAQTKDSKNIARRLLVFLIVIIFLVQFVILMLLHEFVPLSHFFITLIDSAALIVLLFPVLYFLVFRPLLTLIVKRQQAEKELKKAYEEVESQVKERTAELVVTNEQLRLEIIERKRAKELSDTINSINAAIHSTLDFDQIMQHVVVDSVKGIVADAASIDMHENGNWYVRYISDLPKELLGQRLRGEDNMFLRFIEKSKKHVHISNTYTDKRVNTAFMKKHSICSLLAVPLIIKENVIGVMTFFYKTKEVTFSETEIDFANKVAASVSLAIENSNLYEAERNIAETLQEALLALPEEIHGIDFDHLYRSATAAARVGGDFYDLFELEHDKVCIIVGDVSGKGIEATSVASLVKNTIKAYAYQETSPASILSKTNEVAIKISAPSVFVTVFMGVLNIKTGEIIYTSAGHPEPIIKSNYLEARLLKTRSPAIGVFSDQIFTDEKEILKKEECLIIYTDGITEARRNHDFFGEERLIKVINEFGIMTTKKTTEKIFEEVMSFSKGKLIDDAIILSISLK